MQALAVEGQTGDIVFVVDHDELVQDVIDAYETKEPLYIWGRTGIGKSQTVKRAAQILAEKYGRKFSESIKDVDNDHFVLIDRRLANMDPTEILGVLYKSNGVSKWHYPDWLYKLSKEYEKEKGIETRAIVFLDEMNLAPPLTQNGSYSLVLDRRVGDLELADGVVVIAAGNVEEDRAYTHDLADPLKTRFTHVTLRVPVFKDEDRRKGWFYWAIENKIDSRILAFLSHLPNLLFHYVEGDRTFPTPRGWEKASKLMKNKPNEEAWRAVAKACGSVAGLQFRQFMKLSLDLDIEKIMERPKIFAKLEPDAKFSVIGALTHLFSQKPEKYGEKLLKFTAHIFTGIYDDRKLEEYIRLAQSCEREDISKEQLAEIRAKMRQMEGDREAEMAMLILASMKATNREEFLKVYNTSKYVTPLTDLLFFLL